MLLKIYIYKKTVQIFQDYQQFAFNNLKGKYLFINIYKKLFRTTNKLSPVTSKEIETGNTCG